MRLKMQLGRVVDAKKRLVVADSYRFDEVKDTDPDQHQSEKSDIDLHHSERKELDPDP